MVCKDCSNFWHIQGKTDVGYCRRKSRMVGLEEWVCDDFAERVFQSMDEFGGKIIIDGGDSK